MTARTATQTLSYPHRTAADVRRNIGMALVGALVLAVLVAAAPKARAAIATFQDGTTTPVVGGTYSGTADTSPFSDSPDTNYGTFSILYVGSYASVNNRRELIRFNVSALAGQYAQINSITLNLVTAGPDDPGSAYTNTADAYVIKTANVAWVEGVSPGVGVAPGDPTWNNLADPSTPWSGGPGLGNPGGGYDSSPIASVSYSNTTPASQTLAFAFSGSTAALTALIDLWSSGNNAGLLIRSGVENTAGDQIMRFYSREAGFKPSLVIDYTVPEPASLGLLAIGAVAAMRRGKRAV